MAQAGFVEEVARRLTQAADKRVFVGLRRMCSEVARQSICLAHWRRWLPRAKKVRERTANQRAMRVRYEFSISFFDSNKPASRDEASHFSRSRISRHALLFNDADEVSCRAGAIKCSRCRASFAPIRTAHAKRKLVPPLDRLLSDPLSETKNWWNHLIESIHSQARRA